MPARLLVAPDAFAGALRASEVAAAVGRGIERAGLEPPDLCPVAGGGSGTAEVLLLALGGEARGVEVGARGGEPRRAGFALIEDGGTAIVEVAGGASSAQTGQLVAAAVEAGAEVVVVAAAGAAVGDDGAGAVEALRSRGGVGAARLVVLDDPAPGAVAGALRSAFRARVERGAAFVLDALGFDERLRAAGALIVGEGRLSESTLRGPIAGEIAVRARQAGVPAHAVCAVNALTPFEARILDLQRIVEAPTLPALEEAGEWIATHL